jgi:tetratricopeptide (TPR) repeat protein
MRAARSMGVAPRGDIDEENGTGQREFYDVRGRSSTKLETPSVEGKDGTYERASALSAAGRHWEALRLFGRLRNSGVNHAELIRNLGWCHLVAGDAVRAEACMRETVAATPDDWRSHYGLGETLRVRDPVSARGAFAEALVRSPNNLHCLLNLSVCELARRDATAAEFFAQKALKASGDSVAAWTNLGFALLMQERLQEAGEAFGEGERLASALPGEDVEDLSRGVVLRLLGRTAEAIEYYLARLPEHPSVSAHAHYAIALLTAGKLPEGWDQYEFRWLEQPLLSQQARYDRPQWDGQDLRGKTILLRCEQGVGDVFQFVRYAPLVKARGATVYLELRPGPEVLADMFPGIDKTFRHGEVMTDFDYYIDLMSLSRVFRTTVDTIPADVPYIHVPANIDATWRTRFAGEGGMKVGLVWAGDPVHARDRQRSMPLNAFATVITTEGTRWFSMQKGPAARTLREMGFDKFMVDLEPLLFEYVDTAAAIQNLDLVVTVDTSVAHLAGALGKPVWVLLPFAADWRWMENRDDSPWYPTMRLFRQRMPDDWQEVIDRVQNAMLELVRSQDSQPRSNRAVATERRQIRASDAPSSSAKSVADDVSRVCRTWVGMMQYLPRCGTLSTSIAHYGEYLQSQIDILQTVIPPAALIAEAPAGVGLHSIALARFGGAGRHVIAIESSRILRRILRQNLIANGIKDVTVVPSVGTDIFLDELNFERLDVLKINEAAQVAKVLDGGETTLWRLRPTLFLACESRATLRIHGRRVIDFGYRCWCIDTALFNPANFNRRHDDIFRGARSLALLAMPEECQRGAAVPVTPDITLLDA